jgi:hypothetical protein
MKADPADAVRKAKAAVEGLEEPYKMEAFKLILERLMSQGDASTEKGTAAKPKRKQRAGSSKASGSATAPRADRPKTTLALTVEQLKKLQTFYSRFIPKGGEVCAFIIANFVREELKKQAFSASDIEYCYRQLISMKSVVPPIKDFYTALNWLTAPSRKKEWLHRDDQDHWSVSNAGLIAFNQLEVVTKK